MNTHAWLLLITYGVALLALAVPLGRYITMVMEGRLRLGAGPERILYRLCGVRADEDMGWLRYALAILLFNLLGALAEIGRAHV